MLPHEMMGVQVFAAARKFISIFKKRWPVTHMSFTPGLLALVYLRVPFWSSVLLWFVPRPDNFFAIHSM
jgi:hypothetical protein